MGVTGEPSGSDLDDLLRRALTEDLGLAGDLTTDATIPADHRSSGTIIARQAGIVAGIGAATRVFTLLDRRTEVSLLVGDGDRVEAGERLATIAGRTFALLTGERTCLNLLGRLSGIATATRAMVDRIDGTTARIVDTRKTTPGLRSLEKYAVRCGGGVNHRFGLYDAVMIKDNHIAAVGSLEEAVAAVRESVGHMVKIEVEVDTLDQLDTVLTLGVDVVLLDNMTPETLAEAVRRVDGRCVTEASGGIDIDNVRAIAETGVDLISVGALTHSSPQLDVALDL
jgi:nicotinate-nucleotide pyrophosphorylase (carboxylating)